MSHKRLVIKKRIPITSAICLVLTEDGQLKVKLLYAYGDIHDTKTFRESYRVYQKPELDKFNIIQADHFEVETKTYQMYLDDFIMHAFTESEEHSEKI